MDKCLESYKTKGKTVIVVKNAYYYMKKAIAGLIIVLIVFSFIFGENLFAELGTSTLMLLIAVVINLFFNTKTHEKTNYDIEFDFFDNYLMIYRNKKQCTPKVTRRDFFTYRCISKVEYDYRLKRLDIHGNLEGLSYNYNKDGTLPEKPSKITNVKNTYEAIYLVYDEDVDNIINLVKKYINCEIVYIHEEDK